MEVPIQGWNIQGRQVLPSRASMSLVRATLLVNMPMGDNEFLSFGDIANDFPQIDIRKELVCVADAAVFACELLGESVYEFSQFGAVVVEHRPDVPSELWLDQIRVISLYSFHSTALIPQQVVDRSVIVRPCRSEELTSEHILAPGAVPALKDLGD